MRVVKKAVSALLFLSLAVALLAGNGQAVSVKKIKAEKKTASQKYAEAMYPGWNLGNTMDSYDAERTDAQIRETAWGQPKVVKEVFDNVKKAGYKSVRIPLTFEGSIGEEATGYKIDEKWIARIKEVVEMAMADDLYVVINVHHDSWLWLNAWDGNETSMEYKKYCALWEQIAEAFKEYDEKLSFETINEPQFTSGGESKILKINAAGYKAIRNSGGKNATRMILLPTLNANHEKCEPLYNQIVNEFTVDGKTDLNVIATVHYYGEWVYSANLGKTGFDEVLWDEGYTQRKAVDKAFKMVYDQFTKNGIGVVIGEFGLLGYDSSSDANEKGEELKYYDYCNYMARNYGMTLMLWDNGTMLDRTKNCAEWKIPVVGEWLEKTAKGRGSYATGLDTVYLKQQNGSYEIKEIKVPLTLNGNIFTGIKDQYRTLIAGIDYTYDQKTATVTLKKNYVKLMVAARAAHGYGTVALLRFKFNEGPDWQEYIRTCKDTVYKAVNAGDSESPVKLSVDFNGNQIRRVTAYSGDAKVGPQSSWWGYLQYGSDYLPDYKTNTLNIKKAFFADGSVPAIGKIKFTVEMYNGDIVNYEFERRENGVTMVKPSHPSQEK